MALSTLNGKYKNISSYLFFGEKKLGVYEITLFYCSFCFISVIRLPKDKLSATGKKSFELCSLYKNYVH